MTTESDDSDLRPEALRALAPVPEPPERLEQRVLQSLRANGTLTASMGRRWFRRSLAAAALVAAFIGGRLTTPSPAPPGPRWMVLLYEDAAFRGPDPGAEQSYVEEYRAWAAGLRRRRQLVDGAELLPAAAVLGPEGAGPSAPPASDAARLTGYFIIVAPTLEAARALTADIPHLRHQGRVTIQPLGAS